MIVIFQNLKSHEKYSGSKIVWVKSLFRCILIYTCKLTLTQTPGRVIEVYMMKGDGRVLGVYMTGGGRGIQRIFSRLTKIYTLSIFLGQEIVQVFFFLVLKNMHMFLGHISKPTFHYDQ